VSTFAELVAEGAAVPVEGWDFAWFDGRASEQRPSWGYASLVRERVGRADAVLDIQTGGGEVFAEALAGAAGRPSIVAATESWPPNATLAAERLRPYGGTVSRVDDLARLPYPDGSFDLIVSRHPVVTVWPEVARTLRPAGVYLSQQVGPGSVRELTDFMMGPRPVGTDRDPRRTAAAAERAGLTVVDLRPESLLMEFGDIAAVIVFLRKVIWIVPDFTVERYRDRLAALHERITERGPFVAHSERFLIEAVKPGTAPTPRT
jgi:SAM-dependent methyltransferase